MDDRGSFPIYGNLIRYEREIEQVGQVAAVGAELLAGVGVARWKAWPAVEKCLLI